MKRSSVVAVLLCVVVGLGVYQWRITDIRSHDSLDRRFADIVQADEKSRISCQALRDAKPLVILILGQSNAANHGEFGRGEPRYLIHGESCFLTDAPFPGATGKGGSIWAYLPGNLVVQGRTRPLAISIVAVDATTIAEWTTEQGPLWQALTNQLRALATLGLVPSLIVWQQGEADAKQGTNGLVYADGLRKLADHPEIRLSGAHIAVAQSTICRSPRSWALNAAVVDLVARDPRFVGGADTDMLNESRFRIDGCHFSQEGLSEAAILWTRTFVSELSSNSR